MFQRVVLALCAAIPVLAAPSVHLDFLLAKGRLTTNSASWGSSSTFSWGDEVVRGVNLGTLRMVSFVSSAPSSS